MRKMHNLTNRHENDGTLMRSLWCISTTRKNVLGLHLVTENIEFCSVVLHKHKNDGALMETLSCRNRIFEPNTNTKKNWLYLENHISTNVNQQRK